MGILNVLPPFGDILFGGVGLGALALGVAWLLDRALNLFGYDIPDERYTYYAKFIAAGILIIAIVGALFDFPQLSPENGFLWQIIVAILTALGYDFGRRQE